MNYKMSADTNETEKAVGGVLTFAQAGWLALGAFLFGGLFLTLNPLTGPVAALIIAAPPGAALGAAFAFYKQQDLTLWTYLLYRRKFQRKTKQLVNDLTYKKTFLCGDELFQ